MKKFILLLVFSLYIFPSNVLGLEFHVAETKIGSATKDDFVELNVTLSMEDWGTIDTSNTGAMMYLIGLRYNTNDLVLLGAQADDYVTTVIKDQESDMYVVTLVYAGSQNTSCAYGYLSCSESITANINFRLINKDCEDTEITIDEALATIATVTSVEDGEVEMTDMLNSTYYFTHKVKFKDNIRVTTPAVTSKIKTANINDIGKITKLSTTKKITTKKIPTTKKTTKKSTTSTISSKKEETSDTESLENKDIVSNIIDISKEIFTKLREKEEQKKVLKYGLIVIGIILVIIITIKLKNHKLNKKFKDF